jgi:hypothetical protein
VLSRLLLALELRAWRRADQCAVLWWRDDDAGAATDSLRRLLALATQHDVPLALAVIPADSTPQTVALVNATPGVTVLQHGVDHRNALPEPGPRGQFVDDADAGSMARAILSARAAISLFQKRASVYVPPWNRIQPQLERALRLAGIAALSANGDPGHTGRIDVHVDILRWKGQARFRGSGRVYDRLRRELRQRRRHGAWTRPIGLLTHHLDHDQRAWRFLERLFAWTNWNRSTRWISVSEALKAAG